MSAEGSFIDGTLIVIEKRWVKKISKLKKQCIFWIEKCGEFDGTQLLVVVDSTGVEMYIILI